MFSALLAREVARRVDCADYRALAAASYMGIGTIWAQVLSGSARPQMASAGALQPAISAIVAHGGLVPGCGSCSSIRFSSGRTWLPSRPK